MSKYVLIQKADQDMDDIWEYIARDDIEAATGWDTKLREAFDLLARNPKIGHRRKDLTLSPVLFWPVAEYLIIYRTHPDHIEILAVSQGSRDIPSYLRRR